MLARIAHELYWLGRNLARAEHTARMLDGVFHADLQGRPDDPPGVRLGWDALLRDHGRRAADGARRAATRSLRALTLDADEPAGVVRLRRRARARARARCAT